MVAPSGPWSEDHQPCRQVAQKLDIEKIRRDHRRQSLINTAKKLAVSAGDQIGDQLPKFSLTQSCPEMKKARGCGLFAR